VKPARLAGSLVLAGALGFALLGAPGLVALGRAQNWLASGRASTPVCSYRERTGQPCLGCGGTRALELAAHGRLADAWRANPLGAWAGVVAWLTALLALAAVWTGNSTWLWRAAWTVGATAPPAFAWTLVWWWISLPPGPTGP
jgi:hypothetical protein